MGRFDGKVAFITGAARGQGRSHAVRFAEEGADIIAVDINETFDFTPYPGPTDEDLAETVRQVEALGRRIVASKTDVRDAGALSAVVDRGVTALGRLDMVSANAGVASYRTPENLLPGEWQTTIDINLTGVWNTAMAAVPHLKAAGGGSIVFTSSTAAARGGAHSVHYSAAKHGLNGLMNGLACDLGPHRIRVNTIRPTSTDTPMIQNEDLYRLFRPDLESPSQADFAEAAQRTHLLPTPWVDSADISNLLLFLCSDEARFITGASIPVDAGFLTR